MINFIKNKETGCGILAIFAWSLFPLVVLGFGNTPPMLACGLSFLIAGLISWLYYNWQGYTLREIVRARLTAYIFVMAGFGGYVALIVTAFTMIPAYDATILNYLWPIMLIVLTHILTRQKLHNLTLLSIVAGFSGVILIYTDQPMQSSDPVNKIGYGLAVGAALIWAGYSALTRYNKSQPYNMPAFMCACGVILLILHSCFETAYTPTVTEGLFIILFGLTRISFILWDYGMTYGNTILLSGLSYLTPVMATGLLIGFGWVPGTLFDVLGGLLILASCLILTLVQANHRPAKHSSD